MIKQILITVPHSIPDKADNEFHPYDEIAYKVGDRIKDILRQVDVQAELLPATEGRLKDENRPGQRSSNFRKQLQNKLDKNTLVVDLHSYPEGMGDFSDSKIEIFKFRNKYDEIVENLVSQLKHRGWKAYAVKNRFRAFHSDIVNEVHNTGYPAILVEVNEANPVEDVAQALATVLNNYVRGDYEMMEKIKPYEQLQRKNQRLHKIFSKTYPKEIEQEIQRHRNRLRELHSALKERRQAKVRKEHKKEVLYKIDKLESKMDRYAFKEKLRHKDKQKMGHIQNQLYKLYEGLHVEQFIQKFDVPYDTGEELKVINVMQEIPDHFRLFIKGGTEKLQDVPYYKGLKEITYYVNESNGVFVCLDLMMNGLYLVKVLKSDPDGKRFSIAPDKVTEPFLKQEVEDLEEAKKLAIDWMEQFNQTPRERLPQGMTEEIVDQGQGPKEKDYPQAFGPSQRLEKLRKEVGVKGMKWKHHKPKKGTPGKSYDFSDPKLKYGSDEWNALSKAYKADPNPGFFKAATGEPIERKGDDVHFGGQKGFYMKLRDGSEHIVDKDGRTIANYDGYRRNGFEKKFGKPEKYKSKEQMPPAHTDHKCGKDTVCERLEKLREKYNIEDEQNRDKAQGPRAVIPTDEAEREKGFKVEKSEHPELSDDLIKKLVEDHLREEPHYYSKELAKEQFRGKGLPSKSELIGALKKAGKSFSKLLLILMALGYSGTAIKKALQLHGESMKWNIKDFGGQVSNKEGYLVYDNKYFLMKAMQLLKNHDIKVFQDNNMIYFPKSEESKIRDIFKKFGFQSPIIYEKLRVRQLKEMISFWNPEEKGLGKFRKKELVLKLKNTLKEYGLDGWKKRMKIIHYDLTKAKNLNPGATKVGLPKYWVRGEQLNPGKYKTKGGEEIIVHDVKGNKATISGDDAKNKEIDIDALKAIVQEGGEGSGRTKGNNQNKVATPDTGDYESPKRDYEGRVIEGGPGSGRTKKGSRPSDISKAEEDEIVKHIGQDKGKDIRRDYRGRPFEIEGGPGSGRPKTTGEPASTGTTGVGEPMESPSDWSENKDTEPMGAFGISERIKKIHESVIKK